MRWNHPGRGRIPVNLSAIELEQPDLLETITGVIERTGIAPGRLVPTARWPDPPPRGTP